MNVKRAHENKRRKNKMNAKITVNDNPSKQEKDKKIKEISFYNSEGEYFGFLMSLRLFDGKPVVNLYRIDEGITINVSEEREKRL